MRWDRSTDWQVEQSDLRLATGNGAYRGTHGRLPFCLVWSGIQKMRLLPVLAVLYTIIITLDKLQMASPIAWGMVMVPVPETAKSAQAIAKNAIFV